MVVIVGLLVAFRRGSLAAEVSGENYRHEADPRSGEVLLSTSKACSGLQDRSPSSVAAKRYLLAIDGLLSLFFQEHADFEGVKSEVSPDCCTRRHDQVVFRPHVPKQPASPCASICPVCLNPAAW